MAYENIDIDNELSLRQLRPDDATRLFELVSKDRDYLAEYLPWPKFINSVDDEREAIDDFLQKRSNGEEFGYGIFNKDQLVGHISLMHLKDGEPEIGYWVASDQAGKGVTTRAARALTTFGFNTLQLDKIVIRADSKNIGSNKVAEKSGYMITDEHVYDENETINTWSKSRP